MKALPYKAFAIAACICLTPALPASGADNKRLPDSAEELTLSFAETVRKTAPAVVTVYAKRLVRRRTNIFSQFFSGSPFRFGLPRERMERALGSGVIVQPDGLIVTNFHVVRNSRELTVAFNDQREFDARLVLGDEASDLAILQIDAGDEVLPYLEFLDSDVIEAGDIVLAIGNPFGVGQTVTNGIVSARPRSRAGISDMGFFIQTDAAINSGNSGGALVTLDGKLAGINTAIFTPGGGSVGVGFAIPANMVRLVVEAAEEGRAVRRLWIGASFENLTPRTAAALGLPRASGALVQAVYPAGPADRAGLRAGDIIFEFNGRETNDVLSLLYRITLTPPRERVSVAYYRDGERNEAYISAEAAPEIPPREVVLLRGNHPLAGLRVANLSPALAQEISADIMAQGVIVLAASPQTRTRQIGFRKGDIIRRINEQEVSSTSGLTAMLDQLTRPWRIQIERGGQNIIVSIR